MIVMKFGGTSVEDGKAIDRVAQIVSARLEQKPVEVVSAMSRITDSLVAMSRLAAADSLEEALRLLRQMRQRHIAVLATLVKPKSEGQVRADLQILFDAL